MSRYRSAVRHLYLHGFASSPLSRKAQYLRAVLERAGLELEIPDLNVPSFEHMTITAMVDAALETIGDGPCTLWGSSLGGFVAANVARKRPQAIERLLLLAPAMEFPTAFPPRVQEAVKLWEAGGSWPVFHHKAKAEVPMGPELYRDCANWQPMPRVSQPVWVLGASYDGVIPRSTIERWAALHPQAQLEWIDATHEMIEDLPGVALKCCRALGLPLPHPLPPSPV